MRRHPLATAVLTTLVAITLTGCSVVTVRHATDGGPAGTPAVDATYFDRYPDDAIVDSAATCIDADLPDITVDDAVAAAVTVFDDQRRQYPEQSFPSNEQVAEQKRQEWDPVVTRAVPPGGDGAFARQVCGLRSLDGALYSATPLRRIRGYVAEQGRLTCTDIAASGTQVLWQRIQQTATSRDQAADAEYLVRAALVHVCPQLAERVDAPGAMPDCADLSPDPSARTDSGLFCRPN